MPGDVGIGPVAARRGDDGLADGVPPRCRNGRPDAAPRRESDLVERRAGEDFEGKAVDVALATDVAQSQHVLPPIEVAVREDALAVAESELVEPWNVVGMGNERTDEHPPTEDDDDHPMASLPKPLCAS